MERFADVDCAALRWVRPDPKHPAFDLLSEDRPLAHLSWVRPSGSLAHAETADGAWTLKRTGFLHGRVTLRREGSPEDVAQAAIHWHRTAIEIAGGSRFPFERAGLAVPAWQVKTPNGARAIHLEPVRERGHLTGGLVSVEPALRRHPELPVLLLMTWYYVAAEWFEDDAVAATAAVVASVS